MQTAPEGAPNVLLVLLDDVGFGQTSTFGGPVQTPTLQRLADEGLRYNRFHTTALCSPTRAALLTGRNHHSVHTGIITELATGFPGYDGIVPKDAALCRRDAQAATATAPRPSANGTTRPTTRSSPPARSTAGRRALGFEYFWGFHGGETNQWYPPLYENTTPIEPPHDDPNWHLLRGDGRQGDLVDRHSRRPPRRTSPSSSTSRPARRTLRITSPRSGPTSTRASSTTAGTSSARSRSSTRRSSASSRKTPS